MANAARVHAAERGADLTESVLIAFGGNGPLHAADVARKVGVKSIRVPQAPGVGSAIGFLCAPISHEIIRSRYTLFAELDVEGIEAMLLEMEHEARQVVRTGGMGLPVRVTRSAFMRYRGQGHEIEVELGNQSLDASSSAALRTRYETAYADLYGRVPPDMTIEIRNWAVAVSTPARQLATTIAPRGEHESIMVQTPAPASKRTLHLVTGSVDVNIYERQDLGAGVELRGPLIVAEAHTSSYVPDGAVLTVEDQGDLVITLGGQ